MSEFDDTSDMTDDECRLMLRVVASERDALRAERDDDRRREYGYSQQTVDALTKERDALMAEVEALRERNAEWERKASAWMASPEAAQRLDGCRELAQQLNAAEAERDALRADAERYRVARAKVCIVGDAFHVINLRPTYVAPDAAIEFDAAIDAARGES